MRPPVQDSATASLMLALGQQLRDDLFHRGVALGVDEVCDSPAHALAQFLELALGLARLALDRHAQRNLREGRAKRDPRLLGLDQSGDRLVESRLADAEGLEDAHREDRVAAAVLSEPRDDAVLHHRFHLARHARHHDQMAGVAVGLRHRHPKARRGAERIANHLRGFGQVGLLEIVLGHHAVDRREDAFHVVDAFLVAHEFAAGDASHGLVGQVVGGRSDSAGRDDHVGHLHGGLPRPLQPLGHVADGQHRDELDAGFGELVGEVVGIGVHYPAGGDFVAGGENDRLLNHRWLPCPRVPGRSNAPRAR